MLAKLKAWCYHSETVAWGYFKILAGTLLLSSHEIFDYVSDFMADTNVKEAIQAMNFPAYVGLGLAMIGFVTVAVRLRKASINPVSD